MGFNIGIEIIIRLIMMKPFIVPMVKQKITDIHIRKGF